nr:WD40/YVTN repeat-like-containing domain-containing protein [Tanacetum cinerariifolium]
MLNMVTTVHLKLRLSIRSRATVKTLIFRKIFAIFNNSISVVIEQEEKRIEEEQAANARYWKILACCDDDDDYNSAITPVLSTEEPVDSLSMGDEHLDTIPATESDKVIKSSVEDLVPILSEFEGILDTMCDVHLVNNPTPLEAKDHFEIAINSNDDISSSDDDSLYNENIEYVEASPHDSEVVSLEVAEIVIPKEEEIEDDNLREKLLNVHLLIANIEALKDDHTPSSKFLTKSSSTSPKSFLEETNTFHNSLPEFENFCFDLEEISSGSTTTHSDISLSDYEAFYFDDDHFEEISSGSTTTHSYVSLSEYDSFIFDLANDQFLPTDKSDLTHEEFADELAHIISPPDIYHKNRERSERIVNMESKFQFDNYGNGSTPDKAFDLDD